MIQLHEGEALQNAARMSKLGVHGLADAMEVPRSTLYYNFKKEKLDDELKEKAANVLGIDPDRLFGGVYNPAANRITGDALRRMKAFGDGSIPEGIPVVPSWHRQATASIIWTLPMLQSCSRCTCPTCHTVATGIVRLR
jgi:hypothetical protein